MNLAPGLSGISGVQLERIAYLLLKRDILTSCPSKAVQRLNKVKQELHCIKRRTLVATAELQALEIRTLNVEKRRLKNFPADQNAGCEMSIERQRKR